MNDRYDRATEIDCKAVGSLEPYRINRLTTVPQSNSQQYGCSLRREVGNASVVSVDRVRPTSGVLSLSVLMMNGRPVIQIVSCTSPSTLLDVAITFVLVCTMFPAEALLLAPVHWNTSNPT